MGARIQLNGLSQRHGEPIGDLTVYSSELSGVEVSGDLVVRMIDEFPVFAVAAAHATGLSRVRDAQELRLKESDRITALCRGLRSLGIHAEEAEDGFYIHGGGGITGGVVNSAGDHRLAMAFAVAGLAAREEVVVLDAEYIAESYPQFVESLEQLGANLVVEE
jgi:3-phosphoshikimate 1-carboxyvinyltransferase